MGNQDTPNRLNKRLGDAQAVIWWGLPLQYILRSGDRARGYGGISLGKQGSGSHQCNYPNPSFLMMLGQGSQFALVVLSSQVADWNSPLGNYPNLPGYPGIPVSKLNTVAKQPCTNKLAISGYWKTGKVLATPTQSAENQYNFELATRSPTCCVSPR